MKEFAAGYLSGIVTAAFFVVKTADALGAFREFEEYAEWKAERDKNTVDSTAKEIPQAA